MQQICAGIDRMVAMREFPLQRSLNTRFQEKQESQVPMNETSLSSDCNLLKYLFFLDLNIPSKPVNCG